MSGDADLVLPGTPSRRSSQNVPRMHAVRKALTEVLAPVGMTARFPAGQLQHQAAHGTWQLDYASEFGPQGIMLEISIRPVLRPPRDVRLRQLLADPLLGDPGDPRCFALAAREAHAEKVRAAFTREAIRDFYDLDRLLEAGADLSSAEFLELVDAKLAELKAPPLARQGGAFGLDANRRRALVAGLARDLPAVLRVGAPPFDLDAMLARFDRLWEKRGSHAGSPSHIECVFWRRNGAGNHEPPRTLGARHAWDGPEHGRSGRTDAVLPACYAHRLPGPGPTHPGQRPRGDALESPA